MRQTQEADFYSRIANQNALGSIITRVSNHHISYCPLQIMRHWITFQGKRAVVK